LSFDAKLPGSKKAVVNSAFVINSVTRLGRMLEFKLGALLNFLIKHFNWFDKSVLKDVLITNISGFLKNNPRNKNLESAVFDEFNFVFRRNVFRVDEINRI
jgi:hypothetical protein